jgi:hypothetical protein
VYGLMKLSPSFKHKLEHLFYAFLSFLLWHSGWVQCGFQSPELFPKFSPVSNTYLEMANSVCCNTFPHFIIPSTVEPVISTWSPMIYVMIFDSFALAHIHADEICTCIEVATLGSTIEHLSCLLPAWNTAVLVLWISASWNLT